MSAGTKNHSNGWLVVRAAYKMGRLIGLGGGGASSPLRWQDGEGTIRSIEFRFKSEAELDEADHEVDELVPRPRAPAVWPTKGWYRQDSAVAVPAANAQSVAHPSGRPFS